MPKPRDYAKEYKDYHGRPEMIRERAQRNQARAIMKKDLGADAIEGKDIDHEKRIKFGGSNARSNLRVSSVAKNRGYAR